MSFFNRLLGRNSNTKLLIDILDSIRPFIWTPPKRKETTLQAQGRYLREQQRRQGKLVQEETFDLPELPGKLSAQLRETLEGFISNNPSRKDVIQVVNKIVAISPIRANEFPPFWKKTLRAMPPQIREALIATKHHEMVMLLDKQQAYKNANEGLQTEIINTRRKWTHYWEHLSKILDQLEIVQEYPLSGMSPNWYAPKLWDTKKMEIDLMVRFYDLEIAWDDSVEYNKSFIAEEDAYLNKDELITMVINKFIKRDDAETIITGFKVSAYPSMHPVPCLLSDNITYQNSEYYNKLYIFRVAENGFRLGELQGGAQKWSV